MVLTSAKAMSASDKRFSSSSRVMVAKLSPTVLSVSSRLRTRSTMLENLGSLGRSGWPQHVRAEFLPFALALDRNQDVLAVLGAKHAVGRDRGMREAHPLRRIAGLRVEQRHRQPVGHHVEHRDPDVGALAAARARNQGFEDGGMRGGAGGDIDDRHPDARGAFRTAGDRGEPALGLDQEIVGLAMGVGAVVAIARDGAADQLWIILAQALQRESRACPSSRV